ncbi:MAG: hypothetical protein Q8K07_02325 [Methylicorpusculum sp.]|uniref:ORC-CDC6 family AAA ATPase n=1 Tax=Methylicorpusculum sp. TaxID=2713644 RepID=UPI00272EFC61|nr:hypothetical protein [Methylicorpusculum sp.]MDP2200828.1 hypothetical protein [Methylicorpusculum sp.]
MNQNRIDENPFDLTKASDFSDFQILNYWVDLASDHGGGLLSILNPKLIMPMMLLGGKGSGKTHLMRYCSSSVQAMRTNNNLFHAVQNEGYLGIYVRANGLNVGRFSDKGLSEDIWQSIFCFYFEVWLSMNLMIAVQNYLASDNAPILSDFEFSRKVSLLFDIPISSDLSSVDSFIQYLSHIQKNIDFSVNNCALKRSIDVVISFSPGKLIFGIPRLLSELIPDLTDTVFVYLIDEVENFSVNQQRFLNTLIRYREGNASIKIGARLYGIKTFDTLGANEPIKQDSEYERVELDSFLRKPEANYKRFVERLIECRISLHNLPIPSDGISGCFEKLNTEYYYKELTLSLLSSYDSNNNERPYISKLYRHITQVLGKGSEDTANEIIAKIRVVEYPLLEKLNILQLYKRWGNAQEMLRAAQEIQLDCANFLQLGKIGSTKYAQVYQHFDSDLLAQLYRDCKRKVVYCGLDTLIHLSQGIPRNLLGILKQIYRRSLFSGERPFSGGVISISSQTEGVMDSAAWYWDDAQPDCDGFEVREAIEALAILFRMVRYSEKPAECDLCTFSIDFNKLTQQSRRILLSAENWSYLIRIRDGSKNKNDKSVDYKFQISPMLAPKWGISAHRRGTIEIQSELGNAIFDQESRGNLEVLRNKRVEGMIAPRFSNTNISSQTELF